MRSLSKRLPSSAALVWKFELETFHYLDDTWNVDKAKRLIKERPRPIRQLCLEPFADLIIQPGESRFGVTVDWKKIRFGAVSLEDPLLVAYGSMGKFPIDGWHRIAKAVLKGEKELPYVGLTREENKTVHVYDGPRRRMRRHR